MENAGTVFYTLKNDYMFHALICRGEEFKELIVTFKELSADEEERLRCEARERYERDLSSQYSGGFEDGMKKGIQQAQPLIDEANARATQYQNEAAQYQKEIQELRAEIAKLEAAR